MRGPLGDVDVHRVLLRLGQLEALGLVAHDRLEADLHLADLDLLVGTIDELEVPGGVRVEVGILRVPQRPGAEVRRIDLLAGVQRHVADLVVCAVLVLRALHVLAHLRVEVADLLLAAVVVRDALRGGVDALAVVADLVVLALRVGGALVGLGLAGVVVGALEVRILAVRVHEARRRDAHLHGRADLAHGAVGVGRAVGLGHALVALAHEAVDAGVIRTATITEAVAAGALVRDADLHALAGLLVVALVLADVATGGDDAQADDLAHRRILVLLPGDGVELERVGGVVAGAVLQLPALGHGRVGHVEGDRLLVGADRGLRERADGREAGALEGDLGLERVDDAVLVRVADLGHDPDGDRSIADARGAGGLVADLRVLHGELQFAALVGLAGRVVVAGGEGDAEPEDRGEGGEGLDDVLHGAVPVARTVADVGGDAPGGVGVLRFHAVLPFQGLTSLG